MAVFLVRVRVFLVVSAGAVSVFAAVVFRARVVLVRDVDLGLGVETAPLAFESSLIDAVS